MIKISKKVNITKEFIIETVGKRYKLKYEDINMKKIADECGISVGLLYKYYPAKDDLINDIFMSEWNEIRKALISEQSKYDDVTTKLCLLQYKVQHIHNKFRNVIYNLYVRDNFNKYPDFFNSIEEMIESILQEGKASANIKPKIDIKKMGKILSYNIIISLNEELDYFIYFFRTILFS